MSAYAKTLAAALATAAVALQAALTDHTVTPSEWITIGLAALGALGVYAVPNNRPTSPSGPPPERIP